MKMQPLSIKTLGFMSQDVLLNSHFPQLGLHISRSLVFNTLIIYEVSMGLKSVQLLWARPHHLTCQEEEVCKVRGVFNSSNLQSASGLPVRFC